MNSKLFRKWKKRTNNSARKKRFICEVSHELLKLQNYPPEDNVGISKRTEFLDPAVIKFLLDYKISGGTLCKSDDSFLEKMLECMVNSDLEQVRTYPGVVDSLIKILAVTDRAGIVINISHVLIHCDDPVLEEPRTQRMWENIILSYHETGWDDYAITANLTKSGVNKMIIGTIAKRIRELDAKSNLTSEEAANIDIFTKEKDLVRTLDSQDRGVYLCHRMSFDLMLEFPENEFVKKLRKRLGCVICNEICNTRCARYKVMVCSRICHKKWWSRTRGSCSHENAI